MCIIFVNGENLKLYMKNIKIRYQYPTRYQYYLKIFEIKIKSCVCYNYTNNIVNIDSCDVYKVGYKYIPKNILEYILDENGNEFIENNFLLFRMLV